MATRKGVWHRAARSDITETTTAQQGQPGGEMNRLTRTISVMAVLALVAVACGDDDTGTTAAPTTTAAPGTTAGTTTTVAAGGPLSEFGENPDAADEGLIAKALGPADPSAEASRNTT